jgi:hypothetical protein
MALDLYGVHTREKNAQNQQVIFCRKPYTRLIEEGEAPVIIQSGQFWTDGGDKILEEDVPKWVWKALGKKVPGALKTLGLSIENLHKHQGMQPVKVTTSRSPGTPNEQKQHAEAAGPNGVTLEEVLLGLDNNDDAHWIKTGFPDLNNVKEKYGKYVSRGTLTDKFPQIVRYREE